MMMYTYDNNTIDILKKIAMILMIAELQINA